MTISFDDIENAFFFVSMDQQGMHNAYLCKETGQIFYTSEIGDSDELPEDVEDPDKYITIPHKNDLELGKNLVIEFTSKYLPENWTGSTQYFAARVRIQDTRTFWRGKVFLMNGINMRMSGRRRLLKNGARKITLK
jgi:hypothetical protein